MILGGEGALGRSPNVIKVVHVHEYTHVLVPKGLVINYGKTGKTFSCPPPPPFKEWKLFVPPFNMAKTSSYCVKTTPKLFVPPLQHG